MWRRPSNSPANEEEDNDDPTLLSSSRADEVEGKDAAHLDLASANGSPATLGRSKGEKVQVEPSLDSQGPSVKVDGIAKSSAEDLSLLNGHSDEKEMLETAGRRRPRLRSPWVSSLPSLLATLVGAAFVLFTVQSFMTRQVDVKGCKMSYMRPGFAKFDDFDTEHTRFASKYSLYLYREGGIDEDTRVKGVPVLFIPGNAGSYKQVRPIAAEAAQYFHDVAQHDSAALKAGMRSLDFFTADFNEDISAFHGQTILDQAEYLNDAVAFILSLYHDARRSARDSDLPDPTSVILVGHSMGGIVARAMLTMPNYQANSINTVVTLSAPHARPPVSFDRDIVRAYQQINDYWREAYAQKWANNNPLWHVTLVSVAGGGLDTVLPSDYMSLSSLVPETHGFTVFTSSVPTVWTGMDHQAILWCDQFRKVIVRALLELTDVNRPGQTKPRADRMRVLKRWLLTGMESVTEKSLPQKEPTTLLTLEDNSNDVMSLGQRFILREFGSTKKVQAHLLPVPPHAASGEKTFTLLTNQKLDSAEGSPNLNVLFCSVFPLQLGQSATLFSMNMDLSGNSSGSTRLACKNAGVDVIRLPSSTRTSQYPFDEMEPWSYLQYDVEEIAEHQYVAIVDKAPEPASGWVIAEFSDTADSEIGTSLGFSTLLSSGLRVTLPASRPLVTEIRIPALHSTLLAYQLTVGSQACGDSLELFTPIVRQYLTEPYESKYFVNVKQANINLHGIAPFMPPPLRQVSSAEGLSLQLWSDPTCNTAVDISLDVDVMGSLGKLYMRYRTIFAAFPLLVLTLVLCKQFAMYDASGTFITFAEGLDLCLRGSLPLLFVALSIFAITLAGNSSQNPEGLSNGLLPWRGNATESVIDYTKNDLLLGSPDPFFWFLVPLFGLVSVGVCVILNYATMGLTYVFAIVYNILITRPGWVRNEDRRKFAAPAFAASSPGRRVVTASILLLLVSTIIPYQFAFVVACIVQLATCTRALKLVQDTHSGAHFGFYNYAHSILMLMILVLPINIPVLLVWIHNLTVHWLTPFSSHHNVFSVMPIILLVETIACGNMIPRITTRFRYVTNALLFLFAVYAAVYGATYAYSLHRLFNITAVWLVIVHSSTGGFSLTRLNEILEGERVDEPVLNKKRP